MNLATDRAPKFSKVELLRKNGASITTEEFHDVGLVITGDYIIVIEDVKETPTSPLISIGKIFTMGEIESYKTTK
jgi:hypothetical protein